MSCCPPGPSISVDAAVGVGEEVSVDGVAEVALEGADRFSFRLALADATVDVEPPWVPWRLGLLVSNPGWGGLLGSVER